MRAKDSSEPTDTDRPRCCLCREPVETNGWCALCRTWPINITPIRHCERGHVVGPSGMCLSCARYSRSDLIPEAGEWRDTGVMSSMLTPKENQARSRDVRAKLTGPGWPEKIVPLREDIIPRRWKYAELRVVGKTPYGYQIVVPASCTDQIKSATDTEVPF